MLACCNVLTPACQVADLLARGLEERTGQAPLQMDVFQGKEPAHFLSLFNGAMVRPRRAAA